MITTDKRILLKESILTKAKSMFIEQGIRAVKMDDIATGLKMSKRTLYEVYNNKYELLTDVLVRMRDENREKLTEFAKSSDNVMDVLIFFFRQQAEMYSSTNPNFFTDLNRYPELLDRLRENDKQKESRIVEFFERGREEGYFMSHVNYSLFNNVSVNVLRDLRVNPQYKGFDVKDVFNSVVYVLVRGICTQKGIARLDSVYEEFVSMS